MYMFLPPFADGEGGNRPKPFKADERKTGEGIQAAAGGGENETYPSGTAMLHYIIYHSYIIILIDIYHFGFH